MTQCPGAPAISSSSTDFVMAMLIDRPPRQPRFMLTDAFELPIQVDPEDD